MKKLLSNKYVLISSGVIILALVLSLILLPKALKGQDKIDNYDQLLDDYDVLSEEHESLQILMKESEAEWGVITENNDKRMDELERELLLKDKNIEELQSQIKELDAQIKALRSELEVKSQDNPSAKLDDTQFSTDKQAAKKVFLTFDDGPTTLTPAVLDILSKAEVPANFFVIGQRMENDPSIVKRAYRDGHMILTHSYTHDYGIYTSFDTFYQDLAKAEAAYEKVLNVAAPSIFRFPGGSSNHSSFQYGGQQFMPALTIDVKERNYSYVDWNVSSGDAGANINQPEKMLSDIKEQSKGKDIIVLLFHDTAPNKDLLEILPEVIHFYGENGYSFRSFRDITAGELAELENRLIANKPIVR